MLKNCRNIVLKVKKIVERFDPSADIYVFDSVVSGRYAGASYIDISVVTEKTDLNMDYGRSV